MKGRKTKNKQIKFRAIRTQEITNKGLEVFVESI